MSTATFTTSIINTSMRLGDAAEIRQDCSQMAPTTSATSAFPVSLPIQHTSLATRYRHRTGGLLQHTANPVMMIASAVIALLQASVTHDRLRPIRDHRSPHFALEHLRRQLAQERLHPAIVRI